MQLSHFMHSWYVYLIKWFMNVWQIKCAHSICHFDPLFMDNLYGILTRFLVFPDTLSDKWFRIWTFALISVLKLQIVCTFLFTFCLLAVCFFMSHSAGRNKAQIWYDFLLPWVRHIHKWVNLRTWYSFIIF